MTGYRGEERGGKKIWRDKTQAEEGRERDSQREREREDGGAKEAHSCKEGRGSNGTIPYFSHQFLTMRYSRYNNVVF